MEVKGASVLRGYSRLYQAKKAVTEDGYAYRHDEYDWLDKAKRGEAANQCSPAGFAAQRSNVYHGQKRREESS
jgi:hypothetical protein